MRTGMPAFIILATIVATVYVCIALGYAIEKKHLARPCECSRSCYEGECK